MKAKKAMKRLRRAEALLRTVIDQYDSGTKEVSDLLGAAKSSVTSAAQALEAVPEHSTPAKSEPRRPRKLSQAARKRLSVAAKKRWTAAKREGLTTLAKPSPKTLAAHMAAGAS